jgi:hypothetical protein
MAHSERRRVSAVAETHMMIMSHADGRSGVLDMTLKTVGTIALAFCSIAASAQSQDAVSASVTGQLDNRYNNSRTTLSPAERTPLVLKGMRIRDMVVTTPALRERRGFALQTSVRLSPPGPLGRGPGPDIVTGMVLLRFVDVSRSKPDAKGQYPGNGEGPALTFWINDFKGLGSPRAGDERNAFTLPNDLVTRGGVTTYSRYGTGYIMLHKAGNLPFRPLTTENFYRLVIAEDEVRLAAGGDPVYVDRNRKIMEKTKADLAALTPSERAAQACQVSSRPVRCSDRNARPLTELSPSFFAGKPKSSAQVITFQLKNQPERGMQNAQLAPLLAAQGQLDFAAVSALLD